MTTDEFIIKNERPILNRAILSVIALLAYGWVNWWLNPFATLWAGQIAGRQFENSDPAYVASQYGIYFYGRLGVPLLLLVVFLLVVWWRYVRLIWAVPVVLLALLPMPQAQAYYDKTDYAENYFILSNESAFYIPDVGANKDSQAAFGSEQYLRENKVAAKRFTIPHVKLENSGLWSNYYVPAGRLIIVDRTPFAREWVDATDRGTSNKREGFKCQSKEGLNITVGVAIGASVLEENSPRFLYRFGVKPPVGDRRTPEVIFTSVFYSKSLTEVMDQVVRSQVQTLVCDEIMPKSLDEANAQALAIMAVIRTKTVAYLSNYGITLDFIGWADTFEFDEVVQKSINDKYAAEKVRSVLDVLTTKAVIDVIGKWTGNLPTTITGFIPWDFIGALQGWVTSLAGKK